MAHEPVEATFVAAGGCLTELFRLGIACCAWTIPLAIWVFEIEIWLMAWFYYGNFLAFRALGRWIYRNNIFGKSVAAVQRRGRNPIDPHARPVDLATFAEPGADPWDTGTTRRRG